MRGLGMAAAALMVAANMSSGGFDRVRTQDLEGVNYRKRKVKAGFFDLDVTERLVPAIKATDADLFGSPKGKRAKRRNRHG